MKKLSENLQDLSDHVANTEQKVTSAEQQSKEKMQAAIQKSKADAKARQESFKANVKQKQNATASQWVEVQDNFQQKVQQIKSKRETEKEAREVKRANQRADDAESYAADSIYFAMLAIDEVEVALLEAVDARAYAESLA